MRIVVGITGASGALYGLDLLEVLGQAGVETHLILSSWAGETIRMETGHPPQHALGLASCCYDAGNLAAPVSSGSFNHQGMVVAPCSMKTLSAIANGYSDNLIARAADVTIKERRPLILLVRETPLSPIHLENMLKLSRIGVTIMPPVPAFYHRPESIGDLVRQTTGRVLNLLKIENSLVRPWTGE